ncbi:MAG: 6-hydroxymethylpterin diphosphokinase MptE-like protein [Candidatus Omnitrophota bacterium]
MDHYARNLDALRKTRPELADAIDRAAPDPRHYRLLDTRSGAPTLEIIADDGKAEFWHSRYDPLREAERDISSIDHSSIYIPLFAGCGLGYSLRLLWDRHREEFFDLVLVERDAGILRLAMEVTRLDDILSDPRVYIHIGEDLNAWGELVRKITPALVSGKLQAVVHPPSQKLYRAYYQNAFEILRQRMRLARAEFDLMIRSGATIQKNLWLNLPAAVHSFGLREAGNLLNKRPAIVVAAGPSLDKNAFLLRQAQSGFTIFCVDTAYRTLKNQGVDPDFVVSTDPTELNAKHFENVVPAPNTILAFDPEVYFAIPARWPHRRMFLNLEKAAFTRWLEETAGPYGYLPKGGSVGHTAFYLARELGADPIIFVGLDLAFDPEGGTTHAAASALRREHGKIEEGVLQADLGPRFNARPLREEIVWVNGVRGKLVPTSQIMALYIRQFGEEFRRTQAKIIDATEGGALLDGTEIMTLEEALRRYALQEATLRQRLAELQPSASSLSRLREEIQRIAEALESMAPLAAEGIGLCVQLAPQTAAGAALRETPEWERIGECFNALYQSQEIKIAMEQTLFSAVYYFIQKERFDRTDIRLNKYKNYFESYQALRPSFRELLKRVETILE